MAESESEKEEAAMEAFMDRFRGPERYEGAFSPSNWEQEFDQIPMFMKKAPSEIDPMKNPDLACLQSIIFDEEQTHEEQAKIYKNEGNDYFKEKDYKKAIIAYTEGLKKKCNDVELNTVLHTNRAAAQFHLGNYRSALNDAIAARKLKPNHLKAITRGALCHLQLRHFSEAIMWCEEGLRTDPKEKKLLETRAKADRLKRTEERDFRKAKLQGKREQSQKEALLQAIKDRNIKLSLASSEDDTEISTGLAEMSLDGLSSESALGAKVCLQEDGSLTWPVLFLYPEHGQSDFISTFHEESRFVDHLVVMFEELPPWDLERKYIPSELESTCSCVHVCALSCLTGFSHIKTKNSPLGKGDSSINSMVWMQWWHQSCVNLADMNCRLSHYNRVWVVQQSGFTCQLYYEDEERGDIYQIDTETTLLQALQHQRYFVKAGTPAFLVLVKHVPFSENYFLGKKVHRLK